LLDGKPIVTGEVDCRRLECAGEAFAYLHERAMSDGEWRIVTVPIN
jgi:hypothetical protein